MQEPPAEDHASDPFAVRIRSFLAHLRTFRSKSTVEAYGTHFKAIARDAAALGLPDDPLMWNEPHVLGLRSRCDVLAPATQRNRMAALAALLSFHGNEVVAEMKQRGRLVLPLPRRREVRHVSADDRHRLFEVATPMERAVLAIGFTMGLRLEELTALRLDDLAPGMLTVRRHGRSRALPLSPPTEAEVRAYVDGPRAACVAFARSQGCEDPDPGTLLVHFSNRHLSPYAEATLGKLLRALGERTNLAFSAHDMRRSCATELAERGVAIEVIQDLLGHEKLMTTRKYVQVQRGRLRAAVTRYQGAVCGETGREEVIG